MITLFLFFKCYTNLQSTRSIKKGIQFIIKSAHSFYGLELLILPPLITCESFDRMHMKIIIFFFEKVWFENLIF